MTEKKLFPKTWHYNLMEKKITIKKDVPIELRQFISIAFTILKKYNEQNY